MTESHAEHARRKAVSFNANSSTRMLKNGVPGLLASEDATDGKGRDDACSAKGDALTSGSKSLLLPAVDGKTLRLIVNWCQLHGTSDTSQLAANDEQGAKLSWNVLEKSMMEQWMKDGTLYHVANVSRKSPPWPNFQDQAVNEHQNIVH